MLLLLKRGTSSHRASGWVSVPEGEHRMNILFASAEVSPYAKAGGLGDVAGLLPPALRRLGHDVRIVMPFYAVVQLASTDYDVLVTPFNVYLNNPAGYGRLLRTALADGTPVYLLDFPAMFDREPLDNQHNGMYGYHNDDERFIIFCRGVMALAHHLKNREHWNPDILHANDWHTGLVPNYLKFNDAAGLPDTACVFTIHNIAYQGKTDMLRALRLSELGYNAENVHNLPPETFNFLLRGIIYADAVSTVSPTYAHEITTPEYGEGLEHVLHRLHTQGALYGMLHGIDTQRYDPATDAYLVGDGYTQYSNLDRSGKAQNKAALQAECQLEVNATRPLLAIVTRLVTDKGIDALITILPALLRLARQVQIVLLGSTSDKEVRYEAALRYIESCYPEQLRLLMGFSPALAHHVYAGSDMMLVPSFFEPCGLIQMIAMRYGSVPIVRKTGGLADTVREEVNGFVFGETTRADWIAQSKNTLLQQISEADQRYVFTTYTNDQMLDAVLRALWVYHHHRFTWGCIQEQGMLTDFSWDKAAQPYLPMYVDAQKRRFREQ